MRYIKNEEYCHERSFACDDKLNYEDMNLLRLIPRTNKMVSEWRTYKEFHDDICKTIDVLIRMENTTIFSTAVDEDFMIVLIAGLLIGKTVLTNSKQTTSETLVINDVKFFLNQNYAFTENIHHIMDSIDDRIALNETGYVMFDTSGSTGTPKSIRLSLRNIAASLKGFYEDRINEKHKELVSFLCCLPRAHVYEVMMELLCIRDGLQLLYTTPMTLYLKYVQCKPSVIVLVPQILNKLYEKQLSLSAYMIVSAGAPLRKEVHEFYMKNCELFTNGYGQTETAASIALSTEADDSYYLTEGVIIKVNPDNELLVRGPVVSDELIGPDGWFHTNDLVEVKNDKLYIIGRKNNIIKLQQGEYVNLDRLTDIYSKYFIVVVCGNSLSRYPNAVVYADKDETDVRDILNKLHEENSLNGYERIDQIIIKKDAIPLTDTMKVDYARIRKEF